MFHIEETAAKCSESLLYTNMDKNNILEGVSIHLMMLPHISTQPHFMHVLYQSFG